MRPGENDRSLTILDTKTRPLNRRRPSDRVPANTDEDGAPAERGRHDRAAGIERPRRV